MTEQNQVPHIDADRAIALMEAAVADRGADYVYPRQPHPNPDNGGDRCLYWHGPTATDRPNQPGCLVGYALYAAGVPAEWLAQNEMTDAQTLCDRAAIDGLITVDVLAGRIFVEAQAHQDDGCPWGTALRRAREWYADHC